MSKIKKQIFKFRKYTFSAALLLSYVPISLGLMDHEQKSLVADLEENTNSIKLSQIKINHRNKLIGLNEHSIHHLNRDKEISKRFIKEVKESLIGIESILDDTPEINEIMSKLKQSNIKVVNDINVGGLDLNYLVADGYIFLKKSFMESDQYKNSDHRALQLELLLRNNGNDYSQANTLLYYSLLNSKDGLLPLCTNQINNKVFRHKRIMDSFSIEKRYEGDVKDYCQSRGLVNCVELEASFNQIGFYKRNKITIEGSLVSEVNKKSDEAKCKIDSHCLKLYENAPIRQLHAVQYQELKERVHKNCLE